MIERTGLAGERVPVVLLPRGPGSVLIGVDPADPISSRSHLPSFRLGGEPGEGAYDGGRCEAPDRIGWRAPRMPPIIAAIYLPGLILSDRAHLASEYMVSKYVWYRCCDSAATTYPEEDCVALEPHRTCRWLGGNF